MAFHITNLSSLSASLQGYADTEGFIPEKGDNWQQFHWPHNLQKIFADQDNGEAQWHHFVAKAIAATQKAEQALEELRFSDQWHRRKRRKF